MSFENTEKWLSCKRRKIATTQTIVECNVSLDSDEEIQKILSVLAKAQVENIAVNNDVVVTGKVVTDLIYLTTENKIGNLTTTCPFEVKENVNLENAKVFAKAKVLEANIQEVNHNTAKIVFVVEVDTFAICNTEIAKVSTLAEDICYKEQEQSALVYVGDKTEELSQQTKYVSKENINKILAVETGVSVKDYTVGYNFVSVQGEVITRLVYTVEDEEKIYSTYINESFKHEVEFENLPQTALLNLNYDVVYDKVLTNIEDGENKTVTVNVPVKLNICAFDEKKLLVVEDLYSTECNLNVTTNSYEQTKVYESEYFENKIEGSFTLSEENPRVDKLLTVGGCNVILSNAYVKENELVMEGVVTSTIIYLNDELGSINSVQLEFPFVTENKLSIKGELEPSVNIVLCDVDVMVKKGREVYFDAKIKALVNFYEDVQGAVISEVEKGEKYPECDSQMDIYFAKVGESIWEVAKSLKIKEETLFKQNPLLSDPITENNNKIIIYHVNN